MKCPECGAELGHRDKIYTGHNTDTVFGCSICLDVHCALEWFADHPDETFRDVMAG